MAFADIARMYTNSTGTGDLVLTTFVPGFLTFSDAGIPDGVDFSYTILNGPSKRAVGRGTWDSATSTFTRDPLEISSNNGTLGGLLDVQGSGTEVAVTFLARDIADLAGSNNSGAIQTTFLVSGGQVIWTSGLTFLVSAAVYYINGVAYASAQQNITLDAADGSNPRIDVIAVDTTGTVVKVTGTAAASPSEPSVDPGTQLKLAIVSVAAAATEPTVTNTSIYAENAGGPTEWNGATSGTGYSLSATADPRNGTTHVSATSLGASAYVQWDIASGTIDPSTQNFLVFYIKSTASWGSGRGLNVNLLSSGVVRGITIPINRQGSYGFNSLSLTSYQQIAIPLTHFAVPINQTFNQVRFTRFGGAISFRMDDVGLQSGGAGNAGGDFLTQDQADALYQPLDADLTALAGLAGVQGDVIYRDSSQWQRLAAGTSGFFLKTNGASANPAWAAAGGSAYYPAFTAPVDGDFAWINQGSATVTVNANGGIRLRAPASATTSMRVRKKSAPSTPYTITACVLVDLGHFAFLKAGLCFRQSSDGKLITMSVLRSNVITDSKFESEDMTSATVSSAANANITNTTGVGPFWLRIADNGTNRILSYSIDGYNFEQLLSEANTTFLTADEVGFFANSITASTYAALTLLSWAES